MLKPECLNNNVESRVLDTEPWIQGNKDSHDSEEYSSISLPCATQLKLDHNTTEYEMRLGIESYIYTILLII